MKVCTKCGQPKSLDEFHRVGKGSDQRRSVCKVCMREANNARYSADENRVRARRYWHSLSPEERTRRSRTWKLRNRYGIEPEQYDAMLADQGGVCAICKEPERLAHGRLAVDHDHATGEVRGLLCFDCNTSLGKLEDHYQNLLTYMERHATTSTGVRS